MGQINFNITFTINGDGSPTCVNVWAGIEKTRNCCGLPYTPRVENWTRDCFTVNTSPSGETHTVNSSINVTGEELELCNPRLKVIIQPCCFQPELTDCTQTPVGPSSLIPGQYVEYTTPISNLAGSACKRYIIGRAPNGPAFPDITIEYTPCPQTDMAICDNNTYNTQIQTLALTAQDLSLVQILDPNNLTGNESLIINRYIEFCSSSVPVLRDVSNNILVAGTNGDYTIIQLDNWNAQTNECCHQCNKYGYCYKPATLGTPSNVDVRFIYQDCADGLLKINRLTLGTTSSVNEKCIINGTVHLLYSSGTPLAIGYPNPISPSTYAALNLFADWSCCSSIKCM